MKRSILISLLLVLGYQMAAQTKKMTAFNPKTHGFKFGNNFKNIFIDAIDWRTGGLCGGMTYASLDYYYSKTISTPKTRYRPNEGSPLQKYLYDRQVTSLMKNLDKWAEIGLNPGGARNNEFFNWGIENKSGSRINELRSFIDRGKPVPLGLQSVGEKDSDPGNHQTLAIGYDFGTAQDLASGRYKNRMKIYVCDPNFPDRTMTLVPNFKEKTFYYLEAPKKRWRTYFVDKKYTRKTPLRMSKMDYPKDNKVHDLVFQFGVGSDDLRGGNDNLNLTLLFHNGSAQRLYNVNKGNKWIDDYSQYVIVPLRTPTKMENIKSVQLQTVSGNDNFNLNSLRITAKGYTVDRKIYERLGSPIKRFTGSNKVFTAMINRSPPGNRSTSSRSSTTPSRQPIDKLRLWIRTGDDDLRGGKDNLNVTIHYKNGRTQLVKNVNRSTRWKDNTLNSVDLNLNSKIYNHSDITKVVLQTTFSGGMGGDNWNMNSLHIQAIKGTKEAGDFYKRGNEDDRLKRFTDKDNTFVAR